MESNIEKYEEVVFEKIKHIDEFGNEYWEARELQKVLEYAKWENFDKAITSAKETCKNSNYKVEEHLPEVSKMSKMGNNTEIEIKDYHLSRYACYLIVQNSDPSKTVVALGQTYFAIQTRKQEISELEYSSLSELDKRYYNRDIARKGYYQKICILQIKAQKKNNV